MVHAIHTWIFGNGSLRVSISVYWAVGMRWHVLSFSTPSRTAKPRENSRAAPSFLSQLVHSEAARDNRPLGPNETQSVLVVDGGILILTIHIMIMTQIPNICTPFLLSFGLWMKEDIPSYGA
jgi:hypothetical protein